MLRSDWGASEGDKGPLRRSTGLSDTNPKNSAKERLMLTIATSLSDLKAGPKHVTCHG